MKKIYLLFSLMLAAVVMRAQTVNVTLRVDMTGQTVSADSVHMVGSFNGWNPAATVMTDEGNNIWAVTIAVKPGDDVEYKFMNGKSWGTEESAPSTCTVGGHNRIFTTPLIDMVVPTVQFGGCPSSVPTKTITFFVDMDGLTIDSAGVHVAGNFNGWSSGGTQLTKFNGSVYSVTATVLASITKLQYKFLNGSSWGKEENPTSPCADVTSHNRLYRIDTIASTGSVPNYKFNTCTLTSTTGIADLASSVGFVVYPTIAHDYVTVKQDYANASDITCSIYSINGQLISTEAVSKGEAMAGKSISVSGLTKGVYLMEVSNISGKSVQRFIID